MNQGSLANYQPTDVLYLWLLTQPLQPIPIGELNLVRSPSIELPGVGE
jgi:hypothetical protein